MTETTIEVEAETLEEAREQVNAQIPEGLYLLSEEIISDGKPMIVRAIADTAESAFAKAQSETPINAVTLEKRVIAPPAQKTMTTEAFDEQNARAQIESRIGSEETIKSLRLSTAGKKGFLGIGKKPNRYQAEVFQQAVVEVTCKAKAKISTTFGEKKPEVVSLAVLAYQGSDGSLKLKGEDANGRTFELCDVTQPALLFVPRETLPHLKSDQRVWSKVKNPEAAFDERSSIGAAPAGGVLAALLAGPIMDGILAKNLLPGEFRINVVDSYAAAMLKVKGVGLFIG